MDTVRLLRYTDGGGGGHTRRLWPGSVLRLGLDQPIGREDIGGADVPEALEKTVSRGFPTVWPEPVSYGLSHL